MWLTEGGQSATGALIDHVIDSHARGAELHADAMTRGTSVYAILNARLDALASSVAFPAALTRELHVQPDFHGNRSPRADPTLRGMISGLSLDSSVDALALLYLSTIQAIVSSVPNWPLPAECDGRLSTLSGQLVVDSPASLLDVQRSYAGWRCRRFPVNAPVQCVDFTVGLPTAARWATKRSAAHCGSSLSSSSVRAVLRPFAGMLSVRLSVSE